MNFLGGSNNTNKLSPQERRFRTTKYKIVQIIQINLVLKNWALLLLSFSAFK